MATTTKTKDTNKLSSNEKNDKRASKQYMTIGIIVVVVAVAAAGVALYLSNNGSPSGSFSVFKSSFQTAPRVAIFATAYNGTVLSGTVGCSTAIIESVVGSRTSHRNASTIDFYIINRTSCTFLKYGLGSKSSNYTTTALSNCTGTMAREPTVYINYSTGAPITTIQPKYLYISGNQTFLSECGVASQLG
ncbi:MAG: hypothetical protein KGH60_00405 [Candidatus Micrarchaeota archaeon]|nr:hypothetical protein [Candidatus Micrarchaeota archaeon]